MNDLLNIPTFLRRDHSDYEKILAEVRARRAASPPPPRPKPPRLPRLTPLEGVISAGLAKAQDQNIRARKQLVEFGYSKGFVRSVSLRKAKRIIEDIRAGKGAIREDQA